MVSPLDPTVQVLNHGTKWPYRSSSSSKCAQTQKGRLGWEAPHWCWEHGLWGWTLLHQLVTLGRGSKLLEEFKVLVSKMAIITLPH